MPGYSIAFRPGEKRPPPAYIIANNVAHSGWFENVLDITENFSLFWSAEYWGSWMLKRGRPKGTTPRPIMFCLWPSEHTDTGTQDKTRHTGTQGHRTQTDIRDNKKGR